MTFNSLEELRVARDEALAKSDFLMLPDTVGPEGSLEIVMEYRKILRNLPKVAEEQGLEELNLPEPPMFAID